MKFIYKLLILSLTTFTISSCEKEIEKETYYHNTFNTIEAISEFKNSGFGKIKLEGLDGAPSSNGCLYIDGLCGDTPLLHKDFGPFDRDVSISMNIFLKSDHGATFYISKSKEKVSLTTDKDLKKCRVWNKYESPELFLKQGEIVTVWLNAGHKYFNRTWIDDMNILIR